MTMNLKHIMAGVAAVATLLSGVAVTGPAMAEDAGTTTTRISADDLNKNVPLTVTANETDISNRNLNAVMLAKYSFAQTDGANITGFDLIDGGKAAQVTAALNAAGIQTDDSHTVKDGYAYDSTNPMVWVVQNLLTNDDNNAGNLRTFLDKLKNENGIQNSAKNDNKLSSVTSNTNQQSATVIPGVYVVFDNTNQGQASIAMMNGTGVYNGETLLTTLKKDGKTSYTLGTVSYKVHSTTVSKKITAAENGTVESNGVSAETAIGKKVSFKMTSTVPNWTGYDKYYYAINDTYSKGLTYDAAKDNMVVTVAGKTLIRNTDYKVTTESGKFHIIFAPTTGDTTNASDIVAMKDKFPVDAAVDVKYDMYVNKNAVSGTADTNTNEVEYSHNPNTVTDHAKTPGETTKVYVGKFTLTKTDTSSKPLAGAEFKVYEGDQTTTPVRFVKVDANTYRKADLTETTGTTDTITSTDQNKGVITLAGLDGKYTVKETKSPFGSVTILPQFTLTIKVEQTQESTVGTSSLNQFGEDSNKLASKTGVDGVTVINARNLLDMPKTGATWLCIFGAMTVLLAAGAFLLLRRGKDSDRA